MPSYFHASFPTLVHLFGPPNAPVDGYKTAFRWRLVDEPGVIDIYDYKATSLYGEGRPTPSAVQAGRVRLPWHVQGHPHTLAVFVREMRRRGARVYVRRVTARSRVVRERAS
jgi:hypothetical protein